MKFKKIPIIVLIFVMIFFIKKSPDLIGEKLIIKSFEILNCKNINQNDIADKIYIKHSLGTNILKTKISDIRNKVIEDFPLIDEAIIKKIYPDKITIEVREVEPIFLITNDKKHYLYDKNHKIIKITNDIIKKYDSLQSLIYVEGDDIIDDLKELSNLFLNKDFTKRVNSLYKIGDRRWDMIIDKKIKIMLPEKINQSDLISIFHTVDKMKMKNNIKTDAIYIVVDARMKGKVFIKNIGEGDI